AHRALRGSWVLPPAEEPVLVEQDPTAGAVFQRRLEVFRPIWQQAEGQTGTQMPLAEAAGHLDVSEERAAVYLRYLRFEQQLAPFMAQREVNLTDLREDPQLRQAVGIQDRDDVRLAFRVVQNYGTKPAEARSMLSDTLGAVQPLYDQVERGRGERLPRGLVAQLTGFPSASVALALDLLRLRDSRIYGTPLAEETPLSRAVQAVEPRFQQEAPGGPEL